MAGCAAVDKLTVERRQIAVDESIVEMWRTAADELRACREMTDRRVNAVWRMLSARVAMAGE